MKKYDVVVIGAGAAGLTAAATAHAHGRRVAILEMGDAPARKVMAAGGGRCNFTNLAAARDRYFGQNPDFVRGPLSRTTPNDILNWATEHNIQPEEKAAGQFFSANGAGAVVNALMKDAEKCDLITKCEVLGVTKPDNDFIIETTAGKFTAHSVILATGGVSFPTLGVSDKGYKIAKGFGHKIVPIRPALCAIATDAFSSELMGITLDAQIRIGRTVINDPLLFTHFGIGGPAVYRASLVDIADGIYIDLCPGIDICDWLRAQKKVAGRKNMANTLSAVLPARLAQWIAGGDTRNIADMKDCEVAAIANKINKIFIPANKIKLHGMQSAEVVRGGVSVDEISSKTMESKLCAGLFLAGEVLDIAGDLGGFNLHWAWASGRVAGENA